MSHSGLAAVLHAPLGDGGRIRTAIVGLGKVAHTHAQALGTIPESHLVGVCSRSAERAEQFATQYGVCAYTDLDVMIRGAGVQVVVICTPHPFHAQPAVQAARAGAHVLVEKPLAVSLRDCDAMLAAAAQAGVKMGIVTQRRLYEPAQRVWAAIQAGKIGRPVLGEVVMLSWRDRAYYESDAWRGTWDGEGGGVLANQAPHQIDLLQWYMGPVDELFGYWDNLNHPYIEVEDSAVAVLRFKNGALGSIVVSNSQKPGIYSKVHVHGSNGASVGVQPDGGAMFIAGMSEVLEPPINDLWTVPGEEALLAHWQEEDRATFSRLQASTHYHRLLDQDFLRAVLDDREPLVPGIEGRKVCEIATAIYRAQRDGRPVKFPLDADEGSEAFDGRRSADLQGRH
jgi:UDP-N-acetyl-2-amino-2-deoxyglucuronate dehydrogenase